LLTPGLTGKAETEFTFATGLAITTATRITEKTTVIKEVVPVGTVVGIRCIRIC
jgi:hypothetical protein